MNGLSECPSSTTVFPFGPSTPVDLTWLNVDSTKVSVSGDAVFTLSAEQVALLYKSSDLLITGAVATPSTSGSSSSSAGSSAGNSGAGGHGSSLSTGALAGIGIGAAAVSIAAVMGAFYLFLRSRRGIGRGKTGTGTSARGSLRQGSGASGTSEDLGSRTGQVVRETLASSQPRYELNGTNSKLSRNSPLTNTESPNPPMMEIQASTPSSPGHPQSAVLPQRPRGVEQSGIYELSETGHNYQELPVSPTHLYSDNSRQNTPIEFIGRVPGGRGF